MLEFLARIWLFTLFSSIGALLIFGAYIAIIHEPWLSIPVIVVVLTLASARILDRRDL